MNGPRVLVAEGIRLSSREATGVLSGPDAGPRLEITDRVTPSTNKDFDAVRIYDSLSAAIHDDVTPTSETSDSRFFCSANLRMASLVKGPEIPSIFPS